LEDLGVTYRVHLWLDGKHIVDFLLMTVELFSSLALSNPSIRDITIVKFVDRRFQLVICDRMLLITTGLAFTELACTMPRSKNER